MDLRRLAELVFNELDPLAARRIGKGLDETAVSRVAGPQVALQRAWESDLHRVAGALYEAEPTATLGPSAWQKLLGVDLPHYVVPKNRTVTSCVAKPSRM